MKLLLDTHLLLRAEVDRLPSAALSLIDDPANDLLFSAAGIWEIAGYSDVAIRRAVANGTLAEVMCDGQAIS